MTSRLSLSLLAIAATVSVATAAPAPHRYAIGGVTAERSSMIFVDLASLERTPPAVRAQILATEHWSLLGTRSTMWSEVMSRITIHLTVVSASLVVLAGLAFLFSIQ